MPIKPLKEYILDAEKQKIAIGHFNISNSEGFWAVVNAAKKLNAPVVIGVSEGERDFLGVEQAKALVDTVRENLPIFINADHSYSVERVMKVADVSYDAAIIDGSEMPFEDNIQMTKGAVEYASGKAPNMLVEGELGFIGKSSKLLEVPPEGAAVSEETMTKVEDAERFVKETGIDLFAPAVGNIHGMVKTGNPRLNIERIKQIRAAVGVPLVLHGGSGVTDSDIQEAIKAGISMIHVNTELRIAFRSGLEKGLAENPSELSPYRYLKNSIDEMQAVVEKKLILFSGL